MTTPVQVSRAVLGSKAAQCSTTILVSRALPTMSEQESRLALDCRSRGSVRSSDKKLRDPIHKNSVKTQKLV